MLRLFPLLLLAWPTVIQGAVNDTGPRHVTGGQPTAADYVWWMQPGCSAVAIAPRWFLTAAHCGYDDAGNEMVPGQIVFRRYPRASESLAAAEIVIHPDFTLDESVYDPSDIGSPAPWDIMLVRTQRNIGLAAYPGVGDPDRAFHSAWWPNNVYGRNPRARVIGFGAANRDESLALTRPTEGQVELTTCQTLYPNEIWQKGFKNICSYKREGYLDGGDSGGPLMFESNGVDRVIGINVTVRDNILTRGERSRSFFATHERMDLHSDWIHATISAAQRRPGTVTLTLANSWGSPCRINGFDSSEGAASYSSSTGSSGDLSNRAAFRWQMSTDRSDTFHFSGTWIHAVFIVRCQEGWE